MRRDTLYIDPRAGSKDLLVPLRNQRLPVKMFQMRYGDVGFLGFGPHGRARIGVEFKSLGDLIACFVDKRLASHQLPGLVRRYDYPYLLVEGVLKPNQDSTIKYLKSIQSRRGGEMGLWFDVHSRVPYSTIMKFLFTLENHSGLRVRFTSSRDDTIGYLASLYHWWQRPWHKHSSHLALPSREASSPRQVDAMFRRPSVLRRVASCLPGVGWHRSAAVAKKFGSVSSMVDASREDWLSIPGIGDKTAQAVFHALRNHK